VAVAGRRPRLLRRLPLEGRRLLSPLLTHHTALAALGCCPRSQGSYFGEVALLLDGRPREASVRAVTFCNMFSFSKDSLNYLLGLYPEVGEAMHTVMERRLKRWRFKRVGNIVRRQNAATGALRASLRSSAGQTMAEVAAAAAGVANSPAVAANATVAVAAACAGASPAPAPRNRQRSSRSQLSGGGGGGGTSGDDEAAAMAKPSALDESASIALQRRQRHERFGGASPGTELARTLSRRQTGELSSVASLATATACGGVGVGVGGASTRGSEYSEAGPLGERDSSGCRGLGPRESSRQSGASPARPGSA